MNSPSSPDELTSAVRHLWASYGRNCQEETQKLWARELRAFNLESVKRECRAWVRTQTQLPSLAELLITLKPYERSESSQSFKPLSESERVKSDAACVMAGLWLHYECGWPLAKIAGDVVGRQLGMDPMKALEEAKRQMDRDRVYRWMSFQARKDPLPGDAEHARHNRIAT